MYENKRIKWGSVLKKISIITVVLNGVSTIDKTIRSVINQDYDNIEYIIIDGGSTDGTIEIIEKYRDLIDIIISEQDSGLYNAMNKGIALASGEIIGIINSDDWYEEGAIAEVVEAFEKKPEMEILFGNMNYIMTDGRIVKYEQPPFRSLWHLMSVNHPATFVKREVYEKKGVFDEDFRISGDFELMNRFWSYGSIFGHLNKTLSCFSLGGISNSETELRDEENRYIREKYFDRELFVAGCLEDVVDKAFPIYLWGAGYGGRMLSGFLRDNNIVEGIIDVDSEKLGKRLNGIEIIRPDELPNCIVNIIISAYTRENEIRELIEKIYEDGHIVKSINDCYEAYEERLVLKNGECLKF